MSTFTLERGARYRERPCEPAGGESSATAVTMGIPWYESTSRLVDDQMRPERLLDTSANGPLAHLERLVARLAAERGVPPGAPAPFR
jgi:hypothetical protein